MLIYLYGPDTLRSRRYLRDLIEQFKKQRDPKGYNVKHLDGKTAETSLVLAEIMSLPFLAEKRMVIIENLLSSSDKELLAAVKNKKELLEAVKNKIEHKKISEATILIVWQGEALGKVKEVKELDTLLKLEKYAQEFLLLTGAQLTSWIQKEVATKGGTIQNDALQYLAQHAGTDMWHVQTLVNQLVAHTTTTDDSLQPITTADVQLFLDEKIDDNVFNLVDAVMQGNRKIAFKLLEGQRQLGHEDGKLFGLIIWQVRTLLSIADILERRQLSSDEIAREIGVHPFVVKKNLGAVKKHSLASLTKIYEELLSMDIKIKTGQGSQAVLLDRFVGGS